MSSFPSFFPWFTVAYTILALFICVATYRNPRYHNNKTRFALVGFGMLVLVALSLTLAHVYKLLPYRKSFLGFYEVIFIFTVCIYQLAFHSEMQKGRGWRIFRIGFTVCAVVLAILIVIFYVYNIE